MTKCYVLCVTCFDAAELHFSDMYGLGAQQPLYWVHPVPERPAHCTEDWSGATARTDACTDDGTAIFEDLYGWEDVTAGGEEDEDQEPVVGMCRCSYARLVTFWPDGVKLSQPSRLPAAASMAVLQHWHDVLASASAQAQAASTADDMECEDGWLSPTQRRLQWLQQCAAVIEAALGRAAGVGSAPYRSKRPAAGRAAARGTAAGAVADAGVDDDVEDDLEQRLDDVTGTVADAQASGVLLQQQLPCC